jgi:hypothetical protein
MSEPSGLTSLDAKTENHPSVEWNSVREKDTVGVRSEPDNAVQLGWSESREKKDEEKEKNTRRGRRGPGGDTRSVKKKGRARVYWRLMSCACGAEKPRGGGPSARRRP